MSSRSQLDLAALRAMSGRNQHRPRDRDMMRATVHELRARGLTAQDIAAALEIGIGAVEQLLGEAATSKEGPP